MALLKAINLAPHIKLVKALERAAAVGHTSTVETILGTLSEQGEVKKDAIRALNRAVFSHRWKTAAYIADFLADAYQPRVAPPVEQVEQELLACLCSTSRPKITFRHADSTYPPDVYGSTNRPNNFFSLAAPEHSATGLIGAMDKVMPPGEILVEFSSTFTDQPGPHQISTDGTRLGLARALVAKISELYVGTSRDLSELSLVDARWDDSRGIYTINISW